MARRESDRPARKLEASVGYLRRRGHALKIVPEALWQHALDGNVHVGLLATGRPVQYRDQQPAAHTNAVDDTELEGDPWMGVQCRDDVLDRGQRRPCAQGRAARAGMG